MINEEGGDMGPSYTLNHREWELLKGFVFLRLSKEGSNPDYAEGYIAVLGFTNSEG